MSYLYLTVFIITIFTCVLFMSVLGNEVIYNYNKSKQSLREKEGLKLKRRYIKVTKRLLKTTVIIVWIAYETYVKSKRPNSYAMGSWLFNINIVENREPIIMSLIGIVIVAVLYMTKCSRSRLISLVSIEKRAVLKKRVKPLDETQMTNEEKQSLRVDNTEE